MKKSNRVLALLSVVILTAFFANIYYHKVTFAPKKAEFDRAIQFYYVNANKIKIICLNDSQTLLNDRLDIKRVNYVYIGGEKEQVSEFFNEYKVKGDTLFIPASIRIDSDQYFSIQLENLEKYYYNGKLIKTYSHK